MENLFEPKVLNTTLNGRKLDLTNKEIDGKKFYSKNEFSIEVIQKRQSTIDFDGFKPLLNAIEAVQKDYAIKVGAAAATAAAATAAATPAA
jgi:hypothetical protein